MNTAIIAAIVILILSGAGYWIDKNATNRCNQSYKAAVDAKETEELNAVIANNETTKAHQEKVIERVKIIKQAPDPSGCAKSRAPDSWAERLWHKPDSQDTQ